MKYTDNMTKHTIAMENFVYGHMLMLDRLQKKKTAAEMMAAYISSKDIDEDICKRVVCRVKEGDTEEENKQKCIECIIDYFGTPCVYNWVKRTTNADEYCVKSICKHYNKKIDSSICYSCEYKLIPREGNEVEIEQAKEEIKQNNSSFKKFLW